MHHATPNQCFAQEHTPCVFGKSSPSHACWKQATSLLHGTCCSVQFRLQEPALLKLAQQLAAGPPTSLLHGWQQPPAALFLNKQDKLQPHIRDVALQQLGQQLEGIAQFDAVFQGAAMRGEGVDELKQYFISKVSGICATADMPEVMHGNVKLRRWLCHTKTADGLRRISKHTPVLM
jgi:hypothetical protein